MSPPDQDAEDLGRFGYTQQLRRTLGGFSSFAVAFSLISVFTGVFANFGHGLRQVGGAVVWSWLVVLAGQWLVASVMADLARRMPLSGYGYQWAGRLVNPHYGFAVGWLLVLQLLTGFPGICATLATQIASVVFPGREVTPWLTAVTLGVIALVTLSQLWGMRLAARVTDVGVWTELAGVGVVSLVLIWVAMGSGGFPDAVFRAREAATGGVPGLSAWALSLLLGAWCLTGFEAAADLAEETVDPRRTVPRAILASLLGSGLAGATLLAGAVGCIRDLPAMQASDNPLQEILRQTTGPMLPLVLSVVGVSIFACALASLAATSRLLFALGRDRMLPGSRWLARVETASGTPRNAVLFVWAVSSALVLGLPTLDLVLQISAVAGYLGYAGILVATLTAPGRSADRQVEGSSRARRTRHTVAVLALLWTLGLVAALTLTPMSLPGISTRYLPAVSTFVGLMAGMVVYLAVIRGRIVRGEAGPPDLRSQPGKAADPMNGSNGSSARDPRSQDATELT